MPMMPMMHSYSSPIFGDRSDMEFRQFWFDSLLVRKSTKNGSLSRIGTGRQRTCFIGVTARVRDDSDGNGRLKIRQKKFNEL
jgi:hypothetical protein